MGSIRLYHLQLVERSKGLLATLIDASTDAGTLGSTHRAVGIVELDSGPADTSKRVTEQRAEEHVGLAGMNLADLHTHLLHDLHAVAEGEYDTLLGSTHQVGLVVLVEIQAIDGTADLTVLQHTLGTIAEWNHRHALTTDGYRGCQVVHLSIANLRRNVPVGPGVQDTSAIDAEEHAQTGLLRGVVDVGKGVHTALTVVVDVTQDTVYHTRSASRSGNLTGVEHIEREGIVRLVAPTVGNRRASLQAQFGSCLGTDLTLYAECRHDVCNQRLVETIIVKQEIGHLILLEVPEHTLAEAADGGIGHPAQPHGNIVARQHHLIYIIIEVGLILLDPCQLGSREVAWGVEQMAQALVCAQLPESLLTVWHGARVTPDDGRSERLEILVDTHQAVHLIGDADGLDVVGRSP